MNGPLSTKRANVGIFRRVSRAARVFASMLTIWRRARRRPAKSLELVFTGAGPASARPAGQAINVEL